MAGGGNYIPTTTYRSYPYASSVFPLNLLGSAYVSLPDYGNYISHQYCTYYGVVIHQQGLGFAGFEKIKTLDYMLNMESIETKDPEMFGVTTQVSSPFKDSYYYYAKNEESDKQANPRVTSTSENDKLRNVWTSGSYQYDAYNNPTQVTQNIGSALTTVTTQTYYTSVTPTRFISGQPLVKTVTRTRWGSSWTDKEDISYDATTRLPLTKITYTGANGANKTGETRWTYDTNGTSAVFTYDSYDRPATAQENAPDGKYLLKTSAYAAGNVSSVQYTSQNGSIGTENFVYANGHNTEIKLNNTASIWKLTEENALGQPTKATTGTMARTYGYTAYGMPTGRTAGSIQNFTYDFDVTGGNLTSRTDNTRSKTESFQYDNLNRLTSAAGQAIVYSAPEVYVKEAGNWKIYYICRDYLGSVTHVANADGSLK